ncbi:hypothetical protein CBF68_05235 [Lactobacillus taiwanensis]|uniref:hypothetical protein n=1 Tax=Lactobacillus taiwanensis TaxID=508451 RepID=UPI000B998AD9|nr:hypothetical protein [Lactobacillus taiwanensis]OYS00263.1 hypothetical protein CBF64_03005 [Lactobacillus taiwanensis]OYS03704.1 hypothetical protein CBF68_05235 [Lactobacillus taiwanensis]
MSEYNKTILTNAGIDLARRANKGTATFQLTRGASSTDNLSGKTVEELQNLTQLPSIQQSVVLSDVINTADNPDTVLGIRMTFDNQNLKTGYNVHTVGIYAKEPGKNEILYGVATAKTPEYIPDFGEQTLFKFDFLMYLVIGRTDKVTVEVSPDDVYRKRDTYNKTEIDAKVSDAVSKLNNKDAEILKSLNDYKQEDKTYHQNLEQQINRNLDTKADKSTVNQQLGTKADKSTTYTKDEVDNRISPKADKSYVDGELSKRADKATTYTKDEVNNKIAGQVKSVNGHRADNNGEVTLPKLKATTLIAYDVPNKRPTFDDNAGFDGNGNFSRWPVDQGVIGQLADAINAKLPIEAGPNNADLLVNSGNKIVYWSGNGGGVKNLPPMNNKQWFFAIKLFDPGWGSVTVVDQDGTYWLNTKNGDIWTGWRSVITNEHLKKLKFVKQSLNQNGDTFQDTKFVTQEADGTFKINIYDSDWTASKVSWLLKNTQSYNIAANTDLNNIKAPGLYHCSGASNIANVPDGMDSWFNMVVNSDNWNGSQAFYATNHNQLYIRTWNSSGFKQWRRVINDDDYNNLSTSKADKANTYTRNEIESKLSGKANTSDVNARLPLSGGNMNKGSWIAWSGSGANSAKDGHLGGIQWIGASDYIKVFGDNNGADNLDLAIQLGDDNSNHISFRDKDGVERAAITADGRFTGGTDWARVGGTGLNNPTLGRYIQHSNTWNDIIGQNNGQMALTAIRDDSNGSENTIGQHSAGVAFGGGDTKGVLSVAWNEPHARIIGGNGNSPTWKKDIAWKDDINNANPSVTVINSFDVANVKEGPHQTWPVKQPWLVDQMALHPFADAINALNTNLSTLRTELMNLKRRVDYNSPQGEFNNTTVNINDLRSTGIYRFANCYIQNGPYPTNNTHWIYLQVTVFDANTVYQTLYEGDNMYGRKSSSPTNWGKWHKYLNQEV